MKMDLDCDSKSFSELPQFKIKKPSMSETYKCYIKLLKKPSKELENLSELISSDMPLSLFEENLRLKVIDSLCLENEVVKILLSQNDYQIQKVLGFKWFFKNLSSQFCIKELFPFISIFVRNKVINRLSKYIENTEEAQKYFEFIRNTYSHERANYLLPRCNIKFIINYVENTKPRFVNNHDVRVVFNICKRYPELGVQILSTIFEIKKGDKNVSLGYKKVIRYLSGSHPDLIVPFLKKYHLHITRNTFGIKLTKKLGAKLKKDWCPDLLKSFLFKEKILFSILNNQEQIKYLASVVIVDDQNLFFHNWKTSNHRVSQLLKLISEEKRLKVIELVFKEVYNSNFSDHSKYWTCEILELLPTAIREPFIQKLEGLLKNAENIELEENVDTSSFSPEHPEELIYLYNSSIAFEKLKEILRKSPDPARRESIVTFMVKNCGINSDFRVLEQLVEFIAAYCRNDDYNVISSFANAISDHIPPKKLNSVIFEKLEELTYFSCLKRSSNYLHSRWKELHSYYRLENNMEVDVNNFFQFIILKSNGQQSFVRDFGSKQSKTFILAVCDEIVQYIQDKSSEKLTDSQQSISEMLLTSLIRTCKGFNEKNKNNRIFIQNVQGLEEILQKRGKEKLADLGAEEWPIDIWEMMFASSCNGDIFGSDFKPIYLTYVVKRKPELILKYLDGVVNTLLTSQLSWDKTFSTLFIVTASFLGITEKVKRMILNEFENAQAINNRKAALTLYSYMCNIEEFSSAVEKYVPKGERVDQKKVGFDEIQMLIPVLIKNVKPRWKNLEFIFKFYFGDFLKSVSSSLLVCCYHTRCDLIIPFLKKKLNAVPPKISYKKNIIKLILELLDRKKRSEFSLKFWEEYKHYSVRSILMTFISKYFVEQPSRDTFRVFEKCILESDEITIESRPNSWDIPEEFFSDYTRTLWLFSERRGKYFRDSFRRNILWSFNRKNIKFLETEICESIIKDGLFNSFSDNGIETFTVLYLESKPDAVETRAHFVLDLIKARRPNSKNLCAFFRILITSSKSNPHEFYEIVKIILENWPEYPLGVLFKERILLTYYSLHFKLKKTSESNKISVEFAKELKKFFSSIEHLNDLVFIYANVLKNFFKVLQTSNAVLVVRELLSENPSRILSILAILSLPKEAVIWHNMKGEITNPTIIWVKKILNAIFNAIESNNDKIVELYMRSKFDLVEP